MLSSSITTLGFFGWSATLARHSLIRNSGIVIVNPDEKLTIEAAKLKLKYYKFLSLADCYLIALAKNLNAILITTDKHVKEVREVPTILLEI